MTDNDPNQISDDDPTPVPPTKENADFHDIQPSEAVPPPPPPSPEPDNASKAAGSRRATGPNPTGGTAKRTRPVFVQPPEPPSKAKKILVIAIPIAIVALVAVGFITGKWQVLIRSITGQKAPPVAGKGDPNQPRPGEPKPLDAKYDAACQVWLKVEDFVGKKVKPTRTLWDNAPDQVSPDEIEVIIKELNAFRESMRQAQNDIQALCDELSKPEPTLTDIPKKRADAVFENQKKYASFLRDLNGLIVEWKDIATKRSAPPASNFDIQKAHPWGGAVAGQWVRHKLDSTSHEEKISIYRDEGVTQKWAAGIILSTWVSKGDMYDKTVKFGSIVANATGEETLTINDVPVKCTVVEITDEGLKSKNWIAQEGLGAGRLVLKSEAANGSLKRVAKKLEASTFSLKGIDYPVQIVEFVQEGPSGSATQTLWFAFDVPGYMVKSLTTVEHGSATEELVDLGRTFKERDERPFPGMSGASPSPVPTTEPSPTPDKPAALKRPDPWADKPEGFWVRYRTTYKNKSFESELFTDTVLKKRSPKLFTYTQQNWNGVDPGKEEENSQEAPGVLPVRVVGEETLTIDGKEYPCQVEELTTAGAIIKLWLDKSGGGIFVPYKQIVTSSDAGRVLARTTIVQRLSREKLTAAGHDFDCVVAEQLVESADEKATEKVWYSPECPWGYVKRQSKSTVHEMETNSTTEVVAWGEDWAKRPQVVMTPKKVEPTPAEIQAKAMKALTEADALLAEAVPLFQEVQKVVDGAAWPKEKDELAALLKKAKLTRTKLSDASLKYDQSRPAVPDFSKVRAKQKNIDLIVDRVDGFIKQIQEKMK